MCSSDLSHCPAFFLKGWLERLCRRRCFGKEAVARCRSLTKEQRQHRQLPHQVKAVSWSSAVTNQNQHACAGSCPGTRSCTSCQQPNPRVSVGSKCCRGRQEWLPEDGCLPRAVTACDSSAAERRSQSSVAVVREGSPPSAPSSQGFWNFALGGTRPSEAH